MFLKVITAKKFWFSVLLFTLEFIVFFNLVRIAVEYKFKFSLFFKDYFNAEVFPSFLVYNLILGVLFGFITSFSRYWRHFKNNTDR